VDDDDDLDPARALSREDLERIRRSLAMATSLPATDAHRLLAEIDRLRRQLAERRRPGKSARVRLAESRQLFAYKRTGTVS